MANLETTQDLVQNVEFGMGEKTDGTSTFRTHILAQLNRAHRAIVAGGSELNTSLNRINKNLREPIIFSWARAKFPHVFNFNAPEDTGTANVTNGSNSVTLTDAPSTSVLNWHIRIDGTDEVYRVQAHSGTSLTLDEEYVGDTDTAATFVIFKHVYDLTPSSGILTSAGPIRVYKQMPEGDSDGKIDVLTERGLMEQWHPGAIQEGMPSKAAIVNRSDTVISLAFNGYPGEAERAELPYVPDVTSLSVGGADPILPKHKRLVLSELALFYMHDNIDDSRAERHLRQAFALFEDLVSDDSRITKAASEDFGRIIPNEGKARKQRRRLHTDSGFEF